MDVETIPVLVIVHEDQLESDEKGIFPAGVESFAASRRIPVETLAANLRSVVHALTGAVAQANAERREGMHLVEMSVTLEVTAEGGVNLVGSASLSGKAGLELRFEFR